MANFAELGIKIDSGDAVEAVDNLDKLVDAGKRSEESAGKTGRAWESALNGLQGDTRQIVQELQALNAKQAQTAQLMASVGRAVTSASDSFTSAAKGLSAMRAGSEQAGQAQAKLAVSTDASAQSGRNAAETSEQQKARLLAMAQASLEASTYVQSLSSSLDRQATATSQANAVLSDRDARQASINSRAQALLATEERLSKSSKESTESRQAEAAGLQELLGKIDPTVAALGRLDEMEQKLQGYRDKKLLDAESFGEYKAKIDQARTALGGADDALNRTGMSARATAAALRNVPAQFTDIVVSLQGGQAPLTVLLQQGGQLKDMFGGIGPALEAVGGYAFSLINPVSLAAAAVAGLSVAAFAGISDLNELNKALVATGGAAGKSASQLIDLQSKLAGGKYFSQANDALLALVQTGKLTGGAFDVVASAATQLSVATGTSASTFVSQFVEAKKDVSAFAVEFNSKYHAISLSVFEQISALEDQGRQMDALKLLAGEVSEEMTRRNKEISDSTRGIAKLWDEATSSVRRYWNELKRGVSADPDQFRMQVLQQQVADLDGQFWFSNKARDSLKKQYTDEIALIQQRISVGENERKQRADLQASIEKQANLQKELGSQVDSANPENKRTKALEQLRQKFVELRETAASTGNSSPLLAGVVFDGDKVSGGAYDTIAKGILSKNKDPAGRTTPVDLTSVNDQQNALKAIVTSFANNQKELDALQKAGIVSQEAYYHQRVALANSEKEQVTAAYEDQIKALEEAKNRSGTTAAQRIQLDQKIADARANMVKAQKDADSELAVLSANEQGRLKTEERAITSYTEALQLQLDTLRQSGARAVAGVGQGGRNRQIAGELNALDDRYTQDQRTLADQYGDGSRGMSKNEFDTKKADLASNHTAATQQILQNYRDLADAEGNWLNGANSAFEDYGDRARDIAGQTSDMIYNTMESVTQGIGDNAAAAIVQGKNLEESMASLGQTIVTEVLSSLIQMGTRYGINTALELAGIASTTSAKVAAEGVKTAAEVTGIGVVTSASLAATATTTTAQVAAAGTTLSAWLPAALVASVGTLGAAAIVGGAGLLAAFALFKGFSGGGYTGDGGVNEPAGVVHKGEVVWSQADIKRFGGVASVEALRSGRMITSGAAGASRAVASDRPSAAPATQGAQVNLYEDASRAGQVQSRTGTDGKQITDLWVSNIRSGGREAKVLEETYGLKRRGR